MLRKLALLLSVLGAVPAIGIALELLGIGVRRATFGATTVCAAGGPECNVAVAEPSDLLGFLPYTIPLLIVATASIVGGWLTLRRPRAGAVVLFTTAVVGAGTILFFAPPIWSLFDFAAGIVAIIAARKSPPAVEAKPAAP